MYPSLNTFRPQEVIERRGELHATLFGLPPTEDDGLPVVTDLTDRSSIAVHLMPRAEVRFDLYQPGRAWQRIKRAAAGVRLKADRCPLSDVGRAHEVFAAGGDRTERKSNSECLGSEAYGWLPPPLVGEGNKVQTAGCATFADPYPFVWPYFFADAEVQYVECRSDALANYFYGG